MRVRVPQALDAIYPLFSPMGAYEDLCLPGGVPCTGFLSPPALTILSRRACVVCSAVPREKKEKVKKTKKKRVDELLVDRGVTEGIKEAQAIILAGGESMRA